MRATSLGTPKIETICVGCFPVLPRRPYRGSKHLNSGRDCLPNQHRKKSSQLRHAPVRSAPLDFDVPEIDADLRSCQGDLGATFSADGVPQSFGNDPEAAAAISSGAALIDRSHWGLLRVSGPDRLTFLHGQTTNDMNAMQPGQGCDTVLVTAQGRIIDLATCFVQGEGVLMLVSPGQGPALLTRLQTYIFPDDKVSVADMTGRCAIFSLAGPDSSAILGDLGAGQLAGAPPGQHMLLGLQGAPVIVAVGSGLSAPGFTFIVDERAAGDLWTTLIAKGAVPTGDAVWEGARVRCGRPAAGAELAPEINPLEAGLWGAVSVTKGCYIGQETLAKVALLDAVKQQLWGISLPVPTNPGAQVTSGGAVIGKVTSATEVGEGGPFALAYLKCRSKGVQLALEGLQVEVEGSRGSVVALPFVSRSFPEGSKSRLEQEKAFESTSPEFAERAEIARKKKEAEAAAEEAAKQARLEAMQARMAAWQAQQAGAKQES